MSPEILDYFFNHQTQTFAAMSEREIYTLHQLYQDEAFRKILPPEPEPLNVFPIRKVFSPQSETSNKIPIRESVRIETNFAGRLLIPGFLTIPIVITDISRDGLGVVTDRDLWEGEIYSLQISIDGEDYFLKSTLSWSSSKNRSGLSIIESSVSWKTFVNLLENDILKKTG